MDSALRRQCVALSTATCRPSRIAALAPCRDATPITRLAPVQASDSEAAVSTSDMARPLHMRQPVVALNWDRWEMMMLERMEDENEARREQAAGDMQQAEEDGVVEAADVSAAAALDSSYFSQYDEPAAHEAWLKDGPLISAWKEAIQKHGEQIRGKVVVDVGSGLGALAVLCAQAGAKHVYAIEGSKVAAQVAERVVAANDLSDRITVIHAAAEQVELSVRGDVLVSQCMGPLVFGGGMLISLAKARQQLLKPGGLVLPSSAELCVVGIEDREHLVAKKQQWDNMAGLDMGAVMAQVVKQPRIAEVSSSQVMTSASSLAKVNITDISLQQAVSGIQSAPFEISANQDDRLFALALYFNASFGQGASKVAFSTDPKAPKTHYHQVILDFPKAIKMMRGDVLKGQVSIKPSGPDSRQLDIVVKIDFKGVQAEASYHLHHSLPLTSR